MSSPLPTSTQGKPPRRRPLATIEEVAEYLGIKKQTLYNWRSLGTGPKCVRVGRHLRYRWADVDAYVDQLATQGE